MAHTPHDLLKLAEAVYVWGAHGPEQLHQTLCFVVLERARQATQYKRQSGCVHPVYGEGSLAAASASLLVNPSRPVDAADPSWQQDFSRILATSCHVVSGGVISATDPATHFHHHMDSPDWADGLHPHALIGEFLFYHVDDAMSIGPTRKAHSDALS